MTDPLFRAYKYTPDPARHPGRPAPLAYFIESSAPDDVDAPQGNIDPIAALSPIDPDAAIKEIARHLVAFDNPTLVVSVHGFNTPRDAVLKRYYTSFDTVHADPAISPNGLVCLGYRWPSESMWSNTRSWRSAAPLLLTGLLTIGLGLAALTLAVFATLLFRKHGLATSWAWASLFGLVTMLFLLFPLASFLLRSIVYFRDTYRAGQYGVPDLVEIIRQINTQIMTIIPEGKSAPFVNLSFLGHSMGAYVVTGAVRVLSDVFMTQSLRESLNEGVAAKNETEDRPDHLTFIPAKVGDAFTLARLVLVSPDIPAEALIANRANFLEASLRRFHEAYLFSNGEDEVLRQISTLANSFSFPTLRWKYGFRLGNVEVVATNVARAFQVSDPMPKHYLGDLRIGYFTLHRLYSDLHIGVVQNALPLVFSYFDCTDYVEGGRRILSLVNRPAAGNRLGTVSAFQHIRLLFSYVTRQAPDVHSGYFDGDATTSTHLIFRLLCLGFDATSDAFGKAGAARSDNIDSLVRACHDKGIQVMLSPYVGAAGPLVRTAAPGPVGLRRRRAHTV